MAQIPKLPSLANGAGALIAAPPSSRKGGPRVNQSKRRMVPVPDAIARAVVVSTQQPTPPVPAIITPEGIDEDEVAALIPSELVFSRERERLIPFLLRQGVAGKDAYNSPALTCDVLMTSVRQVAGGSRGTPNVMKAAMAWHCLETLLQNSINTHMYATLRAVRDDLHDALFFLKDPGVRVTPAAAHMHGTQMVAVNPFMRHLFFFEMYNRAKAAANMFGGKFDMMVSTSQGRQAIVRKQIQGTVYRTQHFVFVTWRKHTKMKKQKRLLKHHAAALVGRDLSEMRLQAAMMRWRYAVEQSRSTMLMERQSMMQFQLQNVKNQFQLQCFKSDKFLRTIEELRVELAVGRSERDEAQRETVVLKEKIEEQGDKKTREMNQKLTAMGKDVKKWRAFANSLVGDISVLSRFDVEDRPTIAELQEPPPVVAEPVTKKKKGGASSAKMADMRPTEQMLLRWVNTILTKHPELAGLRGETQNFTTDLEDGVIFVIVLHVLAPTVVPIALLQEPNVAVRIERLCAAASTLGLAFTPQPHHITGGHADLVALFLASLFTASVNNEIDAPKVRRGSASVTTDPTIVEPKIEIEEELDALTYSYFLEESEAEMLHFTTRKGEIQTSAKTWAAIHDEVRNYTSLLLRNRLTGNPLFIVDIKEYQKYTKLPKSRMKDLHWKYTTCPSSFKTPSDWLSWDQQVDETRKFLRTAYPEMRRVFHFYAGTGGSAKLLSGAEFWQFCGDARFVDKFLLKATIERIFTIVNQEDSGGGDSGDDERKGIDEVDQDDENPITELVPSEFVEAVVRVADGKFLEMMLQDKLKALFTENVLAFTCRNAAAAADLRKAVNAPQTTAVMKKYNKDLGRVYTFYTKLLAESAKGKGKSVNAKTINFQELIVLLSDANMINSVLTENHVRELFQGVQVDSSSEVNGESELSFPEFVSVLPCIACFHFPSPFVPFEKKVEASLCRLIEGVRVKLKAGGVTLGETHMPSGLL